MLGAFLSTFFFSLSAVCASRSIRVLGPAKANLARMIIATAMLALVTATQALFTRDGRDVHGFGGAAVWYFLASGVIGMGIGDIASFAAMKSLGSRLTVVMTQCLAAPIAALAEWMWLGTALTRRQAVFSLIILSGIALALVPSKAHPPKVKLRASGAWYGLLSALGQGLGAVVSRVAYDVSNASGEHIGGVTATFQRVSAGLAVTALFFFLPRKRERRDEVVAAPQTAGWARWRWAVANAVCGAFLGVIFYQWALSTTPSGIVLPIVATTPIVIIPLAYWLDDERPTTRSIVGGIIAVAGAIALKVVG